MDKNYPQIKEKSEDMYCFELLFALFSGMEASPVG
jgi:hypothetical protein